MIRATSTWLFLAHLFATTVSYASNFPCEAMFPKSLQVQTLAHCSLDKIKYLPTHNQVTSTVFNNELYTQSINKNNLGGIKIGPNKILYRSAYLATAPLCIASLAKANVQTVINLYSKNSGYAKQLQPLEQAILSENNIPNYTLIDNFQFDEDSVNTNDFNKTIDRILATIKSARGNVLIHCYAGEHNTGLIFAIANKCINKQPFDLLKQNLACHMDAKTDYGKGAFTQIIKLIKQYPCH